MISSFSAAGYTLAKLGIPRASFYRWYDRYSHGEPEALNDRSPRPDRVWNRIPDPVRQQVANTFKSAADDRERFELTHMIQQPAEQRRVDDQYSCSRHFQNRGSDDHLGSRLSRKQTDSSVVDR